MQAGPIHPWRVQNNRASDKTQTQADFDAAVMMLTESQLWYLRAAAEPGWHIIHTAGEDARFPLSAASPFAGEGCSISLCSNVVAHTNTHTGWLTGEDARGRGAPQQLDGLCRNWFGILPLQCQKVTLRPVPDSASTPSRCAQRGGAPRHRRASGGMAQRLPLNGGQNQAAKKRVRNGREGTSVSRSTWALLWLWKMMRKWNTEFSFSLPLQHYLRLTRHQWRTESIWGIRWSL